MSRRLPSGLAVRALPPLAACHPEIKNKQLIRPHNTEGLKNLYGYKKDFVEEVLLLLEG